MSTRKQPVPVLNLEVTSPLDASRVTEPVLSESPPVPDEIQAILDAEEPAAVPEPIPPAPLSSYVRLPWYKVVSDKVRYVSWGGSTASFGPGDPVSDELHGPGAVERLRAAGILLEEIPPPP